MKTNLKDNATVPIQMENNIPIPLEFFDVVLVPGGNGKYSRNNWLEKDGKTMSIKDTHSSMFRHLAKSYAGERIDEGTKLDHLLSVAFRALALYTRIKRGIVHPDDEAKS